MLHSISKRVKSLLKQFTRKTNTQQTPASEDAIRRGKQFRVIDILNFLLILTIVGYVGYAKLYPFNVIDVTNLNSHGKIPMVNDRVQAGTYAKYDIRTMRYTGDTITVIRNIVNGQTIPLGASLSNRPAGPGAFVVEVMLPVNLNPGKYHFRVCYQAEFALDRTVTECFETETFEVYLPPGVNPDSDGLTIPQDGESNAPVKGVPGQLNFDQTENGNTRTNLVETPETQHQAEQQSTNTTTNPGGVVTPENSICRLTGIAIQEPLGLPLNIC